MHLSLKCKVRPNYNSRIFIDKVLDNLSCLEEIVDSLIGILLDQFNHTLK
jgi:hypothetical protein